MSHCLASPIEPPTLDCAQIHVWTVSLLLESDDVEPCRAILADDERTRSDRFRSVRDRRRFVVGRALLRRLLAAYLRTRPTSVRFGYGAHGKPFLMDGFGLHFNLSHAHDIALIAVASQREVGVDIETVPCDADIDGMARIAFSSAERAALAALAAPMRGDAFCRIWSRKEAFVKARGAGLTYPTQSFSVSHRAMDADALLADDREVEAVRHWRVTDVPAPHGHYAAVAASGRDWSARPMQMTTALP